MFLLRAKYLIFASAILTATVLSTSIETKGAIDMALTITSDSFKDGEAISREYSCEGTDVSPALAWQGAPADTKSFALIVDDPDAPVGIFVHWIAYDIPASRANLKKNEKSASAFKEGVNGFGKTGYNGPCPPKGHGRHRYFFKLYALDVPTLGLKAGAKKSDVETAMAGRVIKEASVMGTYERRLSAKQGQ